MAKKLKVKLQTNRQGPADKAVAQRKRSGMRTRWERFDQKPAYLPDSYDPYKKSGHWYVTSAKGRHGPYFDRQYAISQAMRFYSEDERDALIQGK